MTSLSVSLTVSYRCFLLRAQVLIRAQVQVIHSKAGQQERHEALTETSAMTPNAIQTERVKSSQHHQYKQFTRSPPINHHQDLQKRAWPNHLTGTAHAEFLDLLSIHALQSSSQNHCLSSPRKRSAYIGGPWWK